MAQPSGAAREAFLPGAGGLDFLKSGERSQEQPDGIRDFPRPPALVPLRVNPKFGSQIHGLVTPGMVNPRIGWGPTP